MVEIVKCNYVGNPAVVQACLAHSATDMTVKMFKNAYPREEAYDEQYALDRRPLIEDALRSRAASVALLSPFVTAAARDRICELQQLREHQEIPFAWHPGEPAGRQAAGYRAAATMLDDDDGQLPRPRQALGASPEAPLPLLPCCFVTSSAVLAVEALQLRPGEKVLDMCAGFGTKALVIASRLFDHKQNGDVGMAGSLSLLEQVGAEVGAIAPGGSESASRGSVVGGEHGMLVCNEPNKARAATLEALLGAWLPEDLLAKGGPVQVTRAEVSQKVPPQLTRHGPFDKVLVDAPCSGSRRRGAGPGRRCGDDPNDEIQRNAELAEVLLRGAAALVRQGGLVVYCTTSIEKRENDNVVRKFLNRMDADFEALPGSNDWPIEDAEKTSHGTVILPDQGTQHGPLYLSQLRRIR